MSPVPKNARCQPAPNLSTSFDDRDFRASYVSHHLRNFLADQIHALRGGRSQKAFGEVIGKPQSVVSRLENEDYGRVTLQTLLDIAAALDVALLVRYVDFPTFVRATADFSEEAFAPQPFTSAALRCSMHDYGSQDEPTGALKAFLAASYNSADPIRHGGANSQSQIPNPAPSASAIMNADANSSPSGHASMRREARSLTSVLDAAA
jgi:transcriptional regulator with XRE-family HTH domain